MKPVNASELQRPAEWLRKGRLDATETFGNVATRILVENPEGTWVIPLNGSIDVVNDVDGMFMENTAAVVNVVTDSHGASHLEVSHTGIDDVVRRAIVNTRAAHFQHV